MVQNEKKFCPSCSISQEPYIRWSSFVVCKCKMIIYSGFFPIFSKLWFFRLLGGSKGIKWPEMTKNSVVCHALYLRNHTSYDLHLWGTCVIGFYLQVFVHLFQIFIFGVNSGVKGQKIAQNDKKLCLSYSISRKHTSYDCGFWFTFVKWWHLQMLFLFF